jgi:hypothetical protein
MSAYPLVSLQTPDVAALGHGAAPPPTAAAPPQPVAAAPLEAHPAWDQGSG